VHAAGRTLPAPIAADASGAITFDVPRGLQSVLVEWAPAAAPDLPALPFRRLYHLDLGPPDQDGVRRRLDHIGVSGGLFLQERIRDFQDTYGHPVDGLVTSVAVPLAAYHDRAMLPPLDAATGTVAGPPLPPEERGPRQGALSGVLLAECHVSLQMLNTRNEPIANTPFALEVGGGRLFEGRTDGQGRLEFGDVEAGDYALRIGDLRIHVPAVRKSERHRPLVADE
jgi:hypothetical protein